MNISSFFVSRPRFAAVLSLVILLVGLIALPSLPIGEYPEVVPPTVVVRTTYAGADPAVIAETVASPIEQSINGVEGMLYQSSQSTPDGVMTLTVTFALGVGRGQGADPGAEPGGASALAQAAAGGAAGGRDHHKGLAEPRWRLSTSPPTDSRYDHALPVELRPTARDPRRAGCAPTASATCSSSARGPTPCASGSTRKSSPPRSHHRRATW